MQLPHEMWTLSPIYSQYQRAQLESPVSGQVVWGQHLLAQLLALRVRGVCDTRTWIVYSLHLDLGDLGKTMADTFI